MILDSLAVLNQILAEVREGRREIATLLREIRDALIAPTRARLSCEEAGRILRVDRHKIADLCRAGAIPHERTGRAIWISRETVERLARDGMPPEKKRGRPVKKRGGAYEEIAALMKRR